MKSYSKQYSLLASILGAFMVFVYAGVGIIFLFFPDFVNMITGYPRILLGILLIIYSVFRIYRIYKTWRERDEEE